MSMNVSEKVAISPTCAHVLGDECQKTLEVADRGGPESHTQRTRDLREALRELRDAEAKAKEGRS
jgi:hypothetical protein